MSLFHESFRAILAEFEKFLNETLKKEKLGKKVQEHKQLILEKLSKFYDENPQMKPATTQDPSPVKELDESSLTGSSVSEDNASADQNYIDAGIGLVSATDFKDPVHTGFLEKRQKKGLFGGGKFQKRWCVIHAGVFYYYATQKDKQQNGAFQLEGYKFRNAPDLSSKKNEKELCFELYHDNENKRIYQFMAKSKTDYEEWQNVLENGGKLIEEDMYEEVGMNRPDSAVSKEESKVDIKVEDIAEDVYEEPPEGPVQAKSPPPPPSPKGIHKAPQAELPEPPPVPPPPVSSGGRRPPPALPPIEVPAVDQGEIYDDALSAEQSKAPVMEGSEALSKPPEVPPLGKRGNRPQRDLPPPPPVKKKIKLNITFNPVEDFENRFYGKWDCEGDNPQELSFKRGDIIYILSREFDDKSWWVGELNGKFGLVPKNYLIPAYVPCKE